MVWNGRVVVDDELEKMYKEAIIVSLKCYASIWLSGLRKTMSTSYIIGSLQTNIWVWDHLNIRQEF